jgi:hypothetical protein
MGGAWSALVEIYFVSSLAWGEFFNTGWDTFYVLAGKGGVWSTQVEIYFVFSLAWEGFGAHKLKYY